MADFQFLDESGWIDFIKTELENSNTPVTDWTEGSANRTFWEVVAKLASESTYMQERLMNLFFADTEELVDSYLDRRASERGIFRKLGSVSQGSITISRSTPAPFDIPINQGTTFSTIDGIVTVETTNDIVLVQGQMSVNVSVKSIDIGSKGNLTTETNLIQNGVAVMGIEKIAVTSPGLTGGTDDETDEQLLARFLEAIQHPENGGSVRDYIRWAKEVPGVVNANCIELARGPGTLDVIILSANGLPTADLITAVQNYISIKRPVCADVRVTGPNTVPININLKYYSNSVSDLKQAITSSIQTYINNVGVGGVVRISQITKVVTEVNEVIDVALTSPNANISLDANQIAVIDLITITKGG
jgi:uncharacterized phage protein gp47/JayE